MLPVVGLQGSVHTYIKQPITVLHHAVDIVAGHAKVLASLFLQDMELVSVVAVQSVSGSYPYKSVAIQVDLRRETTRHLPVSLEELSHLGKGSVYSEKT